MSLMKVIDAIQQQQQGIPIAEDSCQRALLEFHYSIVDIGSLT